MSTAPTSTPTIAPPQRDPADVAPADSYHPSDRVWVYRDGWRAGIIEAASPHERQTVIAEVVRYL